MDQEDQDAGVTSTRCTAAGGDGGGMLLAMLLANLVLFGEECTRDSSTSAPRRTTDEISTSGQAPELTHVNHTRMSP